MSKGDPSKYESILKYDELWQILCHSCETLECLDLYDVEVSFSKQHGVLQYPHLGPLCDFKRLKDLRIQWILVAVKIHDIGPDEYQLPRFWPESLRFLTLYDAKEPIRAFRAEGLLSRPKLAVGMLERLTLQSRQYHTDIETMLAKPFFNEVPLPETGQVVRLLE